MIFFFYAFDEPLSPGRIAAEINQIALSTAPYNHKEDMMFFADVPGPALPCVLAEVDRRYVKLGAKTTWLPGQPPIANEYDLPTLKEMGVDLIAVGTSASNGCPMQNDALTAENHTAVLTAGLKALVWAKETPAMQQSGQAGAQLASRISKAYQQVPPDALYRTVVNYQPQWPLACSEEKADIAYLQNQVGQIRAALAAAQPAAKEPLPILFGGEVSLEKAVPLLQSGLVDGIYSSSLQFSAAAFIELIQKTMA